MDRTDRRSRPRTHVPLRAFTGLDGWCLASAGFESRRAVSVGRVKMTVCHKLHVIPSRRTKYKASITVWPSARRRLGSARRRGWHPDLVKIGWYQACARALRRHGYRGTWRWSPWGRFGDFWKSLKDSDSLAQEAHKPGQLKDTLGIPNGPSNVAFQRTRPRVARPGRWPRALAGQRGELRSTPPSPGIPLGDFRCTETHDADVCGSSFALPSAAVLDVKGSPILAERHAITCTSHSKGDERHDDAHRRCRGTDATSRPLQRIRDCRATRLAGVGPGQASRVLSSGLQLRQVPEAVPRIFRTGPAGPW